MSTLLQNMRRKAGITQEKAAEDVLVGVTTLQGWEAGKTIRRKEDLENLCALYGAGITEKAQIILEMYGIRSDQVAVVAAEEASTGGTVSSAVGEIANEMDRVYPIPLGQMVSCLTAVDSGIACVKALLRFVNRDFTEIATKETASSIDRTARSYGITVGACAEYDLQRAEEKADIEMWPPRSLEGGLKYIEEAGKELNREGYAAFLREKIAEPARSGSEEMVVAAVAMKEDLKAMENIRMRAIDTIARCGLWDDDVDVTCTIAADTRSLWREVNVISCGLSFRCPVSEKEMESVMGGRTKVNIDWRQTAQEEFLYAPPVTYSRVTLEQAASMLSRSSGCTCSTPLVTEDEWIQTCQGDEKLQTFINGVMSSSNTKAAPIA